uniref:Uncharacterized protein n=1 Tax=Onchocerca volvulus TaxID=6282 RepID=A0A8R1TZY6_ONCVO
MISGGMLLSCCILPLFYFWFCHPMLCKYFKAIKILKSKKVELEETQIDEIELMEFMPDEAPDHINIRRDPIFDDIKAFRHRHHHLIRPIQRRQQKDKKVSADEKISEQEKKTEPTPENLYTSRSRSGPEQQLASTEITFSDPDRAQLHVL